LREAIEKERIKSEFKNIRINIIILPPIDIIYDLSMITLGTIFYFYRRSEIPHLFRRITISMMLLGKNKNFWFDFSTYLNLQIRIDMDTVNDSISYLRTVKIKINII
jgi:hypothetical protein